MTDEALDLLARRVLLDALHSEWGHESETTVTFMPSKKHQQQVRDMLADPQGWCKRKLRPAWKTALRRVAAFFLTALVGVSAWLAVDTQAREAFFGWIKEMQDTYFVYRFEGDSNATDDVSYRPTWLPEGYSEWYVAEETGGTNHVIYADETGRMLKLAYAQGTDGITWFLDARQSELRTAFVNGIPADLLISNDPQVASSVTWVAEDNTAFYLSAFLNEEELIKLAESVQPTEE